MTAIGPATGGLPRAEAAQRPRALAVALHDVEPATFARCALIRDWLDDLGVERVTLLVIPAPQLHPFPARSPELANWLLDRVDAGDAVAQHGLQHRRTRPPSRSRARCAAGRAASPPSTPGWTRRRRSPPSTPAASVLTGAGLKPRGFVAPGYAYTSALRDHLATRFDWWATLLALRGNARARTRPRSRSGTSSPLKRAASPALVRAGRGAVRAACCGWTCTPPTSTTRATCSRSSGCSGAPRDRVAVTYDDLCYEAQARRPARQLAPGHPPRRHAVRASPAPRRGATSTSGTGTRASTRSPGRTSTATARKRGAADAAARRAPRRLRPAHRVLAGLAALAARAAVRDAALPRRHRAPSRSRRRCWRSRGSGSRRRRRVPRRGPRAARGPRPLADRASATPTATA